MRPVTIKLPNGNHVTTDVSGTVSFSKEFYLNDVLFVPDFNVNLISVIKLTDSLDCALNFSKIDCHLQNQHTMRRIGIANRRSRLYTVSINNCHVNSVYSVNNFFSYDKNIWNLRLGHISHDKMKCMQ
jgi:hypothetical protein